MDKPLPGEMTSIRPTGVSEEGRVQDERIHTEILQSEQGEEPFS